MVHGARGVVRVRAVDEDVRFGNAEGLRDFLRDRVEQVAVEHEHVARDDAHFPRTGLLDHDRDRPQLSLLPLHLVRQDAAADDHVVVGYEFDGRGADASHCGSW